MASWRAGWRRFAARRCASFPTPELGTGPPPHERLAEWARTRRESREQAAAQPALRLGATSFAPQELAQLAKLRDAGVLSEEEFERSKQIALG